MDCIDSRGFADPDAFAIDGHDIEAFALYPVIIHRVVLDRVGANDDQDSGKRATEGRRRSASDISDATEGWLSRSAAVKRGLRSDDAPQIAVTTRKAATIEVFEYVDCEISTDAGGVAKLAGGETVRVRLSELLRE